MAIFGTKIELQNFKLIGKSVNWFIFSLKIQNYSFEFLRQKWPKYHCWFLALKLKHLKWVCLTFNERILRFCQNKTSHESAILQFCAKKNRSQPRPRRGVIMCKNAAKNYTKSITNDKSVINNNLFLSLMLIFQMSGYAKNDVLEFTLIRK